MPYLPVKGYEGQYEVNEFGTVRSLDRIILGKDGVKYPFKGKTLRANQNVQVEYLQVSLWKNNIGVTKYIHRLVAMAHIPNPLGLPEVNHKDGNRLNNSKGNLEWVNSLGNKLHAISTGLRVYTNRLSKAEFIECLNDVLNGESYESVCMRVPYKVPFLSIKIRKIARELGLENDLNESLMEQRIRRARINGAKNTRKAFEDTNSIC